LQHNTGKRKRKLPLLSNFPCLDPQGLQNSAFPKVIWQHESIFSIFGGKLEPVPSRTQGRLPDRARLWLGHETGHSYLPLFIEKIRMKHVFGSLGFRMVELKSTANSANSREKKNKKSVQSV